MTDPTTLNPCKPCHGTGIVGEKCPYPHDVECDCEDCDINCDDYRFCEFCDGTGYLTENEFKANLKEIEI